MKNFEDKLQETLEYIKAGKIGCTWAAVAAKMMLDGKDMKWRFWDYRDMQIRLSVNTRAETVSVLFPEDWTATKVREWLQLQPNFSEVEIKKGTWFRRVKRFIKGQSLIGVRYTKTYNLPKQSGGSIAYTSWVSYTGPDAHCATRTTPYPMITLRIKKPKDAFYKVGFKDNVLHLAQMSTYLFNVSKYKMEKLWESSHTNSERIVGHKLNEEHAAKTTFKL